MSEATLFDRILDKTLPSHMVAEGEMWYAFLDIYPQREGHTLVVPKQSTQHLSGLTDKMRKGLFDGVVAVQDRLSRYFETEDFTVCIHDGSLAGQEVPHVHVHVIPRTAGDGGSTLQAMWPHISTEKTPDHESFAALSFELQEVKT